MTGGMHPCPPLATPLVSVLHTHRHYTNVVRHCPILHSSHPFLRRLSMSYPAFSVNAPNTGGTGKFCDFSTDVSLYLRNDTRLVTLTVDADKRSYVISSRMSRRFVKIF